MFYPTMDRVRPQAFFILLVGADFLICATSKTNSVFHASADGLSQKASDSKLTPSAKYEQTPVNILFKIPHSTEAGL
ncbi:hypothetical protein ACT3CD_03145 [Geofilum sp. OHC36d9]|uniref:hypothetical protein n=1 Tax=Geofilum sp. OHC36d9 TaxID=3458413 RepID=UPI004034E3E7